MKNRTCRHVRFPINDHAGHFFAGTFLAGGSLLTGTADEAAGGAAEIATGATETGGATTTGADTTGTGTGTEEAAGADDVEFDGAEGTGAGFAEVQAKTRSGKSVTIFFMQPVNHERFSLYINLRVKFFVEKVKVGENYRKLPLSVRWTQLERASGDSAFRSECPVCGQGLLLVRRTSNLENFSCYDNCITCGQTFVYEDEEILGTHVMSPKEIQIFLIMES